MSGNIFQTLLGVALSLMASFSPTGTSEPDLDIASRPALTEPTNESSESDTLSSEPCRKSQDPDNTWSLLDLKNYLKEQGGRLSGKKSELVKR